MLQIAEHIMQSKTADFDPALLQDRYRTALVEILRTKKRETPLVEGPISAVSAERHQPHGCASTQHGVGADLCCEPPATAGCKQTGQALLEHTRPKRQLTNRTLARAH